MAKRILLIDDDDGIRDIVKITLELLGGWTILTAVSGQEGLALATDTSTQPPNAILLDVMMPGQDGIETFKQLQAQPRTQNIPVIFLTAKARNSERQKLMDLGCAGTIIKPFEVQTLVQDICQLLQW